MMARKGRSTPSVLKYGKMRRIVFSFVTGLAFFTFINGTADAQIINGAFKRQDYVQKKPMPWVVARCR